MFLGAVTAQILEIHESIPPLELSFPVAFLFSLLIVFRDLTSIIITIKAQAIIPTETRLQNIGFLDEN